MNYHAATEAAAQCMGRAIPSLYYQMLDCYPTYATGAAPRQRLMGQILSGVITKAPDGSELHGPMSPLLAPSTFHE